MQRNRSSHHLTTLTGVSVTPCLTNSLMAVPLSSFKPFEPQVRNVVCIFYLILRALDTVEDDTSIPTEVKLPILIDFHRHVYDRAWHFSCGTEDCKILMDQFHHVSTAFAEIGKGTYWNRYVQDFQSFGEARFVPENLSSIMGVFLQDLQYDENSVKAVQCLNEMITDALKHVEDCLKHMSALKDNEVFRFCAIRPVLAIGTLAFCYNNIDVFKTGVKLRPGLVAKIYDRTRMMTDVYNVFFEFTSVMKSKVETMDDYDEYCHYVTGPIGIGMFKIFKASGKQDFAPENLSSIMGIFLQDLKYEENSVKAAQCLNEMITDALKHVEDCLKHMSALNDNGVFRFCAIRPVLAMGTLALCYNNIDVFKTGVKLRPGLAAKIYERTRTMTDVYNVFFEFASVMKSKHYSLPQISSMNDPKDSSSTNPTSGTQGSNDPFSAQGPNDPFFVHHSDNPIAILVSPRLLGDNYNTGSLTGLVGTGLFKLFKASGKQNLGPENLSHEMGIFLQDLQYEENSVKAVQCLNEMVTDALRHVEDCLKHMSVLKDNAVLRFCAIRPVLAMGTLALCYNNIDVFKSGVKLRSGLAAKIYDRTRTITDVYNAFFEFASVMKFKELLTLSKIWMAAATKCVPCSMGLSV
ncbi:hypothetical protein LWI29_000844 [Acer saccharum]|uniref:Uncharacterized protein n=1 Tax=Acer saccharum TaxID=4024 RepID=A0AA39VFB1_ACESA|nr:hypothetical protein LWI29_000844 [Acer saccharum]